MRKITFMFCLMLLFSSFLYCGSLRVDQMGSGWILPDELIDVEYNPARINYISGNSLDLRLSDYASFNNWETVNGYIKTYPFIGYSGKFGGISTMLAYAGESVIRSKSYTYYTNYLNAVIGTKISEELSWGAALSFVQYDNTDTYHKAYDSDKCITVGLDYSKDGSIFGLDINYEAAYNAARDYYAEGSILYGLKLGENAELRCINTISYLTDTQVIDAAAIDVNSLPATAVQKPFGKTTGNNRTAVSYADSIGAVKYSASIVNNWKFKQKSNTIEGYTSAFKRSEYENEGWADSAAITLGMEMPLFVEWLRLRLKYNPFIFDHFYQKEIYERQTGFDYNHWDYFSTAILPARLAAIGLGIDAGKDLKIDITFGGWSFYYLAHFDNDTLDNDHTTCFNIEALWKL